MWGLILGIAAFIFSLIAFIFLWYRTDSVLVSEDVKFLNELRKESHDRLFRYFVLGLLSILALVSIGILLQSPVCGNCPDTKEIPASLLSSTQPADIAEVAREREAGANERDARIRADGETRAWARTLLTAVVGAIVGYLFGSGNSGSNRNAPEQAGPGVRPPNTTPGTQPGGNAETLGPHMPDGSKGAVIGRGPTGGEEVTTGEELAAKRQAILKERRPVSSALKNRTELRLDDEQPPETSSEKT